MAGIDSTTFEEVDIANTYMLTPPLTYLLANGGPLSTITLLNGWQLLVETNPAKQLVITLNTQNQPSLRRRARDHMFTDIVLRIKDANGNIHEVELGLDIEFIARPGAQGGQGPNTSTKGTAIAEWGEDNAAGSAPFTLVDNNGVPITITGYDKLTSGSLGSHNPVIANGTLAFDAAGAPNGAVLCVSTSSGPYDIAIVSTPDAVIGIDLDEAEALAKAYKNADNTQTKTVGVRRGTYSIDSNPFANIKMSSTRITGIGETRGETPNPVFNGGYIEFRPALGEDVYLEGSTSVTSSCGLSFTGFNISQINDTTRVAYEPESAQLITAITNGSLTVVEVNRVSFSFEQIFPGTKVVITGATGDHAAMNGLVLDVVSVDIAAESFTLDYDSSTFGFYQGGGSLKGQETLGFAKDILRTDRSSAIMFHDNVFDNMRRSSNTGDWPSIYRAVGVGQVVLWNNEVQGAASFVLGAGSNLISVDNYVHGLYGDLFGYRSTRPHYEDLSFYNSVPIANIATGTTTIATTSAPHGLATGDTVLIQDVLGAVDANDTWFADITGPDSYVLKQENPADKNVLIDVDSSAWGSYAGGGINYHAICRIWTADNVGLHANDGTLNSLHTDAVQGSSGQNELNVEWYIYDNYFPMLTENGISVQGWLGKGGARSSVLYEGEIKGNYMAVSAINQIASGLTRPNKTVIEYNASIRQPQSFRSTPSRMILEELTWANGNIVGQIINPQFLAAGSDNLISTQSDDNSGSDYDDVYQGTFTVDADGNLRNVPLNNLPVGITKAQLKSLVIAEMSSKPAFSTYGPEADPDRP